MASASTLQLRSASPSTSTPRPHQDVATMVLPELEAAHSASLEACTVRESAGEALARLGSELEAARLSATSIAPGAPGLAVLSQIMSELHAARSSVESAQAAEHRAQKCDAETQKALYGTAVALAMASAQLDPETGHWRAWQESEIARLSAELDEARAMVAQLRQQCDSEGLAAARLRLEHDVLRGERRDSPTTVGLEDRESVGSHGPLSYEELQREVARLSSLVASYSTVCGFRLSPTSQRARFTEMMSQLEDKTDSAAALYDRMLDLEALADSQRFSSAQPSAAAAAAPSELPGGLPDSTQEQLVQNLTQILMVKERRIAELESRLGIAAGGSAVLDALADKREQILLRLRGERERLAATRTRSAAVQGQLEGVATRSLLDVLRGEWNASAAVVEQEVRELEAQLAQLEALLTAPRSRSASPVSQRRRDSEGSGSASGRSQASSASSGSARLVVLQQSLGPTPMEWAVCFF
eukprot:TRINITY_DN5916_c0_g1_i5.p1 TRINITY_DN5916_c0_g1~~TRINITY_DN5916_c0_g1_i5.p1  ORF type:complete len:473 (-),score=85.76 TRINITY_DN5916_c0_g1_i5:13-1431(-)